MKPKRRILRGRSVPGNNLGDTINFHRNDTEMPKKSKKKKKAVEVKKHDGRMRLILHFNSVDHKLKFPVFLEGDSTVDDLYKALWRLTFSCERDQEGPHFLIFPMRGNFSMLSYEGHKDKRLVADVGVNLTVGLATPTAANVLALEPSCLGTTKSPPLTSNAKQDDLIFVPPNARMEEVSQMRYGKK